MIRKGGVYRIVWLDHCAASNIGWALESELRTEVLPCVSYGLVTSVTKDAVTIVGTMSGQKTKEVCTYQDGTVILRRAIEDSEELVPCHESP